MAKPTYASRFTRVGTSKAIILPKEVRELMGLIPGDLVVMRLFGKILICRKLEPNQIVDVNEIPADALPSAVRG